MKLGDHAAFVDALRDCLGLEPLYSKRTGRRDVERFGGAPLQGLAGYDGDGGRRTRPGTP